MFKKAFMPLTNPVPAAGMTNTMGLPVSSPLFPPPGLLNPSIWFLPSMPAKTAARSTEMNVKKADRVASLDRVSKVLGSEQKKERTAQIAEKPTVHTAPPLMVFKYLAPIKTWRP